MMPETHEMDVVAMLAPLVAQRTSDLPVLPAGAAQALELVRRADGRTDALVAVLERDPTLTARVLGVASSGFYSRGTPPTSLRQALVRLGWNATRDVLTMAVYGAQIFDVPGYSDQVRACFEHCARVARVARVVAPRLSLDSDLAFLAGLLHDVGRARVLKMAHGALPSGTPREEVAHAVDALHERAGGVIARAWRLPDEVIDACETHHAPTRAGYAALITLVDSFLDEHDHDETERAVTLFELGKSDLVEIAETVRAAT